MNRDFAEMLKALAAENVDYLVVGAYAVAGHGIPRATGDIDLLVANKRATGRPQDLADVARLEALA